MKNKLILLTVIIIAVAAAFIWWRTSHPAHHRYVIAKKHIPVSVVKKVPAALSVVSKKITNPKIAIVIDDFGYNKNNISALFDIKQPVTLSILPDLRYSKEIADSARSKGYEVILHLPLEAHGKDVKQEADTIRHGMREEEVIARLSKEAASVPGLVGVSNHQGSKATEDKELMTVIFGYLKANKLYFFDSLTSQKSVCREVASHIGIPYARRDIFLDNSEEPASIEKQFLLLRKIAFKTGRAIAICHDKKNTIEVLSKLMPEMAREGIVFIKLSEFEK